LEVIAIKKRYTTGTGSAGAFWIVPLGLSLEVGEELPQKDYLRLMGKTTCMGSWM